MKVWNLWIVLAVCVLSGCATCPSTRAQWEYKTITWTNPFPSAEGKLNELAKEGWIVVDHSVISPAGGYTFVLKRPLK